MQQGPKYPQTEAEVNVRLDFTDRWIQWVFSVFKAKGLHLKSFCFLMTTQYSVKGSECQIWGELKSVKLIKVDGSSKLQLFS